MKKESERKPEKKKSRYSDAAASRMYAKIHSINDGVYQIASSALVQHSELFTPAYGENLSYLVAQVGDVLSIREEYLDYSIETGLYPHHFNPIALVNAFHLGLSHLQALIVVGTEQPNNMDLHRYIKQQVQRLLGLTTLYNERDGSIKFLQICHYSMQNITEH